MLRSPKDNSKGSEKGNSTVSILFAVPVHIFMLRHSKFRPLPIQALVHCSYEVSLCLSAWSSHKEPDMPSSLWHCLTQSDCISQNVVLPHLIHRDKHLSMPRSCHPKNGLFGFCPYWCLLGWPHYSVVLLNLTEPFLSVLRYMESLTFFPILHSKTVLSLSTGFCRELNYKIEIDGENNIYILASCKSFLPAIHPSCCLHEKNSLLGF